MNETILIVEEHDEIREALHDRLEIAFPYCQILQAKTDREAVATVLDWNGYRTDALTAGASAYILQEEINDKLLSTLRSIISITPAI